MGNENGLEKLMSLAMSMSINADEAKESFERAKEILVEFDHVNKILLKVEKESEQKEIQAKGRKKKKKETEEEKRKKEMKEAIKEKAENSKW